MDRPDLTQSEIRMGHLGLPRAHPDYFPLKLVNYPGTTDWWTLPKEDPNQEKPSSPSAGGSGPLWMERIESTKDLGKDDEAKLHAALKEFKKNAAY